MGKPYSDDLRRGIVQAIEAGHTYEEAAELSGVSVSSVSRLLTRWRNTGSISPEKFGGYKGYADETSASTNMTRPRAVLFRYLGPPPDGLVHLWSQAPWHPGAPLMAGRAAAAQHAELECLQSCSLTM